MVVHFLVQLCEQSVPGIFWGHALPVPEFGELFKAGVKEADAPSRSLSLGHEGFPRVAILPEPLFGGGGR